MHFKNIKRQLPEVNREVIGFNKEWVNETNPEGTRLCLLREDKSWTVVSRTIYFNYATSHSKHTPTHWCAKPIPPMHLSK